MQEEGNVLVSEVIGNENDLVPEVTRNERMILHMNDREKVIYEEESDRDESSTLVPKRPREFITKENDRNESERFTLLPKRSRENSL